MGWQKGRPRKASVVALEELEKRIAFATHLSEDEKQAARERAREHVLKKRKEKALDQYFEAAVKAQEQALDPTEVIEELTIDLPEYTYQIVVNGTPYYHGCTYKLKASQCRSMEDIQANAWAHQREIEGHKRKGDEARRPELVKSVGGNINTRGAMRL